MRPVGSIGLLIAALLALGCSRQDAQPQPRGKTPAPSTSVAGAASTASTETTESPDAHDPTGIYQLSRYEISAENCDPTKAAAAKASFRYLFVASPAANVYNAHACLQDAASCREPAKAAARNGTVMGKHLGAFDERADPNTIRGGWAGGGMFANGTCSQAEVIHSTLKREGETIRIERREHVFDFPGTQWSDCNTGAAQQRANDSNCQLKIYRAKRVEAAPAG